MDKTDAEKDQVQSGRETEDRPIEKKGKKKKGPRSKSFADHIITDSETARERGKVGGVKSGEVRRAKRDSRETVRYMLMDCMMKSKNVKENLNELGFAEDGLNNMAALYGRIMTMAMGGNMEAARFLMTVGGFDTEEIRKERESLAQDKRRNKELDAKLSALGKAPENSTMSLGMGNEDGASDVVIYIPKMLSEEECLYEDPSETSENTENTTETPLEG